MTRRRSPSSSASPGRVVVEVLEPAPPSKMTAAARAKQAAATALYLQARSAWRSRMNVGCELCGRFACAHIEGGEDTTDVAQFELGPPSSAPTSVPPVIDAAARLGAELGRRAAPSSSSAGLYAAGGAVLGAFVGMMLAPPPAAKAAEPARRLETKKRP